MRALTSSYSGQYAGPIQLRPTQLHSLWLLLVLLLLSNSSVRAQANNGTVQEIRTIYPSEWNVPYPAGLAYANELDQLFLLDRGSPESFRRMHSTLVIITPYEDLVATIQLAFTVDVTKVKRVADIKPAVRSLRVPYDID